MIFSVAVDDHDPLAERVTTAHEVGIPRVEYRSVERRINRRTDRRRDVDAVMALPVVDLRIRGRERRVAEELRDAEEIPEHILTLRAIEHERVAERP